MQLYCTTSALNILTQRYHFSVLEAITCSWTAFTESTYVLSRQLYCFGSTIQLQHQHLALLLFTKLHDHSALLSADYPADSLGCFTQIYTLDNRT
jgi:hypothetical protein